MNHIDLFMSMSDDMARQQFKISTVLNFDKLDIEEEALEPVLRHIHDPGVILDLINHTLNQRFLIHLTQKYRQSFCVLRYSRHSPPEERIGGKWKLIYCEILNVCT